MYFMEENTVFFPPGARVIKDFDQMVDLHVFD
jgi:hypothetical protein